MSHFNSINQKMTFRSNLFSAIKYTNLSKTIKDNIVKRRIHSHHIPFRILFFGSDKIALSSLQKLSALKKTTKLIENLDLVTANNSKHNSIIEKYALSQNIKVVQWPLQSLQCGEYDLGLIVAFGHLIKKNLLDKFPLGMVNVHPSLLPRWRGAAPIIHTLLHGDHETGVTLMKIKADKFDVGEIISQIRVPVPNDIHLPELTAQLSEYGADMLVNCVKGLPDCLEKTQPQSNEGVTHARKINKNISEVRWLEMTATDVYNLYRAVSSLYPLSTWFRDKQVKLFDAFLDSNEDSHMQGKGIGTIEYCETESAIKVVCKDKRNIYFRSLRIVGKRKISALDFYNGYLKNNPSECNNNLFYWLE